MLRSAAITRIQRGLGFRTDLTTEIISALQEAQRDLEGATSLPWFLIKESQAFAITAANQTVTLPVDFIRVVENEQPYYTTASGEASFLIKKPFDEAYLFYNGTTTTSPDAYSLRSTSITVWPVPNVNYSLFWSYYARGVLLDSDTENTWLKYCPELLIGLAGMLIAADLENETATRKFGAMYTKWAAWLVQEIAIREEQGNPRALGRNH